MLASWTEQRSQVTEALGGVEALARALGASSLAQRLAADVIHKLTNDRFFVVVVGEFNHGKTTFINAILGKAILPVGVTPTTAVIHEIRHGEAPEATAVLESGERKPLGLGDLPQLSTEGTTASVARVEVDYPADVLRGGIVLVDTPGVNDLSLLRAEVTYGYIPRADAVLFLLDAGQPVKESERRFVEDKLIAQSRDKILFVVAKADIWNAEEREQALRYVRAQLASVVTEPAVFAVSARAALEGAEGSGLDVLTDHLTRYIADNRGRIVLANAVGEGLRALSVLGRGISARRAAAAMTAAELEQRIGLLERDLRERGPRLAERRLFVREQAAAIKARARRDLEHFCDDMARRLPDELKRASAADIRRHLGAFLEHSLRRWAEAESSELATLLESAAEQTLAFVRHDAEGLARGVEEALGGRLEAPSIEPDTFMYDVGVFAVLTFGVSVLFANVLLGGLLIAAAPVLAHYSRERADIEVRRRGAEVGTALLREAGAHVAQKIDERIDDFATRLDDWVVTASEELHREVMEILAQARTERAGGSAVTAAELETCDRAAAELRELEERLKALRPA